MEKTISLEKGNVISLSKGSLDERIFRGGWDTGRYGGVDIDLWAIATVELTAATDTKQATYEVVPIYYRNKNPLGGSVELDKDNLTGEGDGWDENIFVNTAKLEKLNIVKVHFIVDVYSEGFSLGMIENLKVQLFNKTQNIVEAEIDFENNREFSEYRSVIVAKLERDSDGAFEFQNISEPYENIKMILKRFGINTK